MMRKNRWVSATVALAAVGVAFISAVSWAQAGATTPGTQVFTSRPSGLVFDHPADWKLQKNRLGWVGAIPVSTSGTARLEIYESEYRQSVERWQESQRTINETLKRPIERQWQEEVLGVPMLMTRIRYTENGADTTALVALIYTATPRKLNFRLSASSDQFAVAEQLWREALLTLRTTSGQLPQTEDPSKPPSARVTPPPAPVEDRRPPVVLTSEPDRRRVAPVATPARAGNRDWTLQVPNGWTVTPGSGGFTLTHPNLVGSVRVEVNSELDSPPAPEGLAVAMGKTLGEFSGPIQRRDQPRRVNQAGAQVREATRTGKSASGDRFERWATGARGGAYWLMTYVATESTVWNASQRLLTELVRAASVEPVAVPSTQP